MSQPSASRPTYLPAIVAALGAILASNAHASSYQGFVTNVFAFGGKVMVIFDNGGYDSPAATCGGTATQVRYLADPATPYGRALIAIALSAKLSGRLVWAQGDGTCTAGMENLLNLDLKG